MLMNAHGFQRIKLIFWYVAYTILRFEILIAERELHNRTDSFSMPDTLYNTICLSKLWFFTEGLLACSTGRCVGAARRFVTVSN